MYEPVYTYKRVSVNEVIVDSTNIGSQEKKARSQFLHFGTKIYPSAPTPIPVKKQKMERIGHTNIALRIHRLHIYVYIYFWINEPRRNFKSKFGPRHGPEAVSMDPFLGRR